MQLRFKTKNELEKEIAREYWRVDEKQNFVKSVKEIVDEYSIKNIEINPLQKRSCDAIEPNVTCYECKQTRQYSNRRDFIGCATRKLGKPYICRSCQIDRKNRELEEKEQAEQLSRDLNNNRFKVLKDKHGHAKFSSLTLRQICMLNALLRHSADERLEHIRPLNNNDQHLVPPSFLETFMNELYQEKIIFFTIESWGKCTSSFNDEINMNVQAIESLEFIPTIENMNLQCLYTELHNHLEKIKPREHRDEILKMAEELICQECLSYVNYMMKSYGFISFKPDKKIDCVVRRIMKHFSVAQSYTIIIRAIDEVAAYVCKSGVKRLVAADTLSAKLESQIDKARFQSSQDFACERLMSLPQSVYSQVLFDSLFKLNDGGFKLNMKQISELIDQ